MLVNIKRVYGHIRHSSTKPRFDCHSSAVHMFIWNLKSIIMDRRFMNEQRYKRWMHNLFNAINTKHILWECEWNMFLSSCSFGWAFYKVIHSVNNRILCKRIDDIKWTVLFFSASPFDLMPHYQVFSHRFSQAKTLFGWRQTTIDKIADNFYSLWHLSFTAIKEFVMRLKQHIEVAYVLVVYQIIVFFAFNGLIRFYSREYSSHHILSILHAQNKIKNAFNAWR